MGEKGIFQGFRARCMKTEIPVSLLFLSSRIAELLFVDLLIHFHFISRTIAPFWLKPCNWLREKASSMVILDVAITAPLCNVHVCM
jgi:hypothetical protein